MVVTRVYKIVTLKIIIPPTREIIFSPLSISDLVCQLVVLN